MPSRVAWVLPSLIDVDTFIQDLRYAGRQLASARTFFLMAVLTLAVGIGANTALFSYLNAVLFSPLPGVKGSGLLWVSSVHTQTGRPIPLSKPDFDDYRQNAPALAQTSLVLTQSLAIYGDGEAERVRGEIVSGNYFDVLGTEISVGRALNEADDWPGAEPVAVIGHDLWRRRFNADPGVVGRVLHINRVPHVIVGVAPAGFIGVERNVPPAAWVTIARLPEILPAWKTVYNRDTRLFNGIGRLAPGATEEQANAQLAAVAARNAGSAAGIGRQLTARTYSAATGVPPDGLSEILPVTAIAMAVTGLILLIACANVSNLLLSRGVERRRELAVRLALGAGRGRLIQQLLTESLMLAVLASAAGLLLALWMMDLVGTFVPQLPIVPSVDRVVLVFSVFACAAVALLAGLMPALIATRGESAATLRAGTSGADPARARMQSAFIVCQVALSVVLLAIAALFVRSLDKAGRVDPGFDTSDRVLAASIDVIAKPGKGSAAPTIDAILDAAAALPGVSSVSLTTAVPTAEWIRGRVDVPAEGDTAARALIVTEFVVRPEFFRTIGLPLRVGRDFGRHDSAGSPPVAIVNEALARSAWSGRDPIGRTLTIEGKGDAVTVIGIAADSVVGDFETPGVPAIYLAHLQHPSNRVTVLVRAEGGGRQLAAPLREAIARVDAQLPVTRLQTFDRYREMAMSGRRAGAGLLGLFGVVGLGLAAVGVAGAMSLSVTQRTREIGVRLALGAAPGQVVSYFVRRGMRLVAIGLGIGLAFAAAGSRLLSSMLFGITAGDLVAYVAVSAALGGVAGLACWLPARRAARVDPLRALGSQ